MAHGFAKLSKGPEKTSPPSCIPWVCPAPHLMAWLTILTELVGGLAVPARSFRRTSKSADGCGSFGGDANRPPPLWVSASIKLLECDGRAAAQFRARQATSFDLPLSCVPCGARYSVGSGPMAIDGPL